MWEVGSNYMNNMKMFYLLQILFILAQTEVAQTMMFCVGCRKNSSTHLFGHSEWNDSSETLSGEQKVI